MKELRVMMTCSNIHIADAISILKNNDEGRDVKVFCTNSCEWDLPSSEVCDGAFIVPRLDDNNYIPFLLDLCNKLMIDVIMPVSSIDLDIMSENKDLFESNGIHVSVMRKSILDIANNKIELHKRFGELMPDEVIAETRVDVDSFIDKTGGQICCKLANLCGGKGFAVLDEKKASDIELFHRFGKKHYITKDILYNVVEDRRNTVILQRYHDGLDYTVSLLADHGNVKCICGYVGYLLEFGSIMYGEIKPNRQAYDIAEKIVRELELDGNIGIDFILNEDDSVVLLEVNPRFNASLPFVAHAGCNMAYLRCKMLVGETIPTSYDIKVGFKMKKYFGTKYYI